MHPNYPRRPAVAYLYPAILVYSAVLFSTYTIQGILVISLIRDEICRQMDPFDDDDGANCDEDEVSRSAAILTMYVSLASAIPSILVAGYMGAMANRFGRRIPPMIALAGSTGRCVLVAATAQYSWRAEWLILASLLEGSCGTYTAFLMGTSTYIADCNKVDAAKLSDTDKVERYSFTEAFLTLGLVVGPLGGGIAADLVGGPLFFLGAAALLACLVVYFAAVIPESLPFVAADIKAAATTTATASSTAHPQAQGTLGVLKLAVATRPYNPHGSGGSVRAQSYSTASGSNSCRTSHSLSQQSPAPSRDEDDDGRLIRDKLASLDGGDEAGVPGLRLALVSSAFMMTFGGNTSSTTLFILYTSRAWGWGGVAIGGFLSAIGVAGTLGLLLTRRVYSWVCARDLKDLDMMKAGAAGRNMFFACFPFFFFFFSSSSFFFFSSSSCSSSCCCCPSSCSSCCSCSCCCPSSCSSCCSCSCCCCSSSFSSFFLVLVLVLVLVLLVLVPLVLLLVFSLSSPCCSSSCCSCSCSSSSSSSFSSTSSS